MTLTEVFSDIASAINNKGVSGSMKPTEMAEKIASIPSGGDHTYCEVIKIDTSPKVTVIYDGGNI